MPIAKVDSRSFNYAKQSDGFLRLSPINRANSINSPPPDSPDAVSSDGGVLQIWTDLTTSQDAVSSYIICLIAKLISLDSGQSARPLPDVYKEITEMQVDITKYRHWSGKEKPLSSAGKVKALSLQHAIIATIHFLKQFYGFVPSLQLRNMYLRWNLARNYTIDGSAIADPFEVKVLSPFSVAASKDVIRDPLPLSPCSSSFSSSEEEEKLVRELISDCYLHHRRGYFGSLPPEHCKLVDYTAVASSLSYIRLRDLVTRNPCLLSVATNHVCSLLKSEVSHTQDYGERELLLPLLHLMKEFISMAADVDASSIYQSLIPFYMWPSSHSDSVKKVLDLLKLEKKVKGTTYRRTLLLEHDLGLRLKHYNPKTRSVVMLIDTSYPESRGHQLYQSFVFHQEKPSTALIKRLLMRSILTAAPSDAEIDNSDIDNKLSKLSEEQLTGLCEEGIDITEEAASFETQVETDQFLVTEITKLSLKITSFAEASDEQRDSAVSYTSDERSPLSFPLLPPYIPVYQLETTHYIAMIEKIKEVVQRTQQTERSCMTPPPQSELFAMSYPPISTARPDLSQTSLDSTGSSALEPEEINGSIQELKIPDLTSVSEKWPEDGNRSISPTSKSDPGLSHQIKPQIDRIPSPNTLDIPESDAFSQDSDRTSDTSSSRTSEEASSRYSTDNSVRGRYSLERRNTDVSMSLPTSNPYGSRRSTLTKSPMNMYSNQAVSPTVSMGTGSIRGVKSRANPSNSIKLNAKKAQSITASILSHGNTNTKVKVLKIVIAADDHVVANVAKAFTHLRIKEPNLFWNLEVEFHYIPLSQASSGWAILNDVCRITQSSSGEPPEPANENRYQESGGDVLFGRYLAHMDSWYEQNVMLAVHNTLRLLPSDVGTLIRPYSPLETLDTRWNSPSTPSKVLIDVAAYYLREACHVIRIKMFKVKITLKSEKNIRGFEHKEMYMLHKLDIQRLTGKKNNRQAKPYEASVALTELSLDNNFIRGDMAQMRDVWIIRASNIPHPTDSGVPNPENECLELTVMKCQAEGGMLSQTKYRVCEETQHHVYELVVEAKDKSLSVIIDEDISNITENVVRVEVSPAYIDQGITGATLRRTERHDRQMYFPVVSFWQVDL